MQPSRTYQALALAGTLPFVASAAIAVADVESVAVFGSAQRIIASYGLAILCFLCGAHWATALYRGAAAPFNLFVSSNAVVVAVWIAYLAATAVIALGLQLAAFLYLLYVDHRLLRVGLISSHYFRVRLQATAVAVLCLLIVGYQSLA